MVPFSIFQTDESSSHMNKQDSARRAVKGRDPAGLQTSTSLDVRTGSSLITEIDHR